MYSVCLIACVKNVLVQEDQTLTAEDKVIAAAIRARVKTRLSQPERDMSPTTPSH